MDDEEYALRIDTQVEKFIETKQRLGYFVVTAAIAVIAFTLKFVLDNRMKVGQYDRVAIATLITGGIAAVFEVIDLFIQTYVYKMHVENRYDNKGETLPLNLADTAKIANRLAVICWWISIILLVTEIILASIFFIAYLSQTPRQ